MDDTTELRWNVIGIEKFKAKQNFYTKSFTFIARILDMIKEGIPTPEICGTLGISRQLLFYHVSKLLTKGYIKKEARGSFNIYKVTSVGQAFLDKYHRNNKYNIKPVGRVEHVRFKAPVIILPEPIPTNWNKAPMHNWMEYWFELNDVKIKLNHGQSPTIEFIMPPVDDYEGNPQKIYCILQTQCMHVVQQIENVYNMDIGALELSSNGEWVIYDPVAKAVSEQYNVNIPGVAKINASRPALYGEFEFTTPYDAAAYLHAIRLIPELLETMKKVLKLSAENRYGYVIHG
jgi:predicted transcriptional regulator